MWQHRGGFSLEWAFSRGGRWARVRGEERDAGEALRQEQELFWPTWACIQAVPYLMTPSLQGIVPFGCPQSGVPLLAGLLQHHWGPQVPVPFPPRPYRWVGTGWVHVRALQDGEEGGIQPPLGACTAPQGPAEQPRGWHLVTVPT